MNDIFLTITSVKPPSPKQLREKLQANSEATRIQAQRSLLRSRNMMELQAFRKAKNDTELEELFGPLNEVLDTVPYYNAESYTCQRCGAHLCGNCAYCAECDRRDFAAAMAKKNAEIADLRKLESFIPQGILEAYRNSQGAGTQGENPGP